MQCLPKSKRKGILMGNQEDLSSAVEAIELAAYKRGYQAGVESGDDPEADCASPAFARGVVAGESYAKDDPAAVGIRLRGDAGAPQADAASDGYGLRPGHRRCHSQGRPWQAGYRRAVRPRLGYRQPGWLAKHRPPQSNAIGWQRKASPIQCPKGVNMAEYDELEGAQSIALNAAYDAIDGVAQAAYQRGLAEGWKQAQAASPKPDAGGNATDEEVNAMVLRAYDDGKTAGRQEVTDLVAAILDGKDDSPIKRKPRGTARDVERSAQLMRAGLHVGDVVEATGYNRVTVKYHCGASGPLGYMAIKRGRWANRPGRGTAEWKRYGKDAAVGLHELGKRDDEIATLLGIDVQRARRWRGGKPKNPRNTERDEMIRELRKDGATWEDLAEAFELTTARVMQIVNQGY